MPIVTSGAGSIGSVVSKLGIPVINSFGCRSGNVHAPDEWIDINTISLVFAIYKKSLIKFSNK